MIGYVTIGTNNLEAAKAFYDPIAEMLGHKQLMASDRMVGWGTPYKDALLCLIKPHDGNPATVGNGTMIALVAEDEEQIHKVHEYALANGGSDEGAPGPRGDMFYGGYFRDPEGNKLVVFKYTTG